MTTNDETPRGVAGASHKNLAAGGGGGLDAIVSHPLPRHTSRDRSPCPLRMTAYQSYGRYRLEPKRTRRAA